MSHPNRHCSQVRCNGGPTGEAASAGRDPASHDSSSDEEPDPDATDLHDNHTSLLSVDVDIKSNQHHSQHSKQPPDGGVASLETVEPPDGGYGWVVAFVSMCLQFLVAATIISFTILYVEFSRVFQLPKATIGWASSILTLFNNITGVLVSVILRRYGSRPVAVMGASFAALGYFLSAFVNSVYELYFTFGVLTGFGIGSMVYSSIVIVQQWFDKRRALAAGMATIGMSLGNMTVGPLTRFLLELYGWRGCLILLGGMCLHGVPLALLLRPSPSRPQCVLPMGKMFRDLLDFSLLRKPVFVFYSIGMMLNYMSTMAWLQHMGSRAHDLGLSLHQVSLVPTYLAICSLSGRLVFTVVANFSCTNRVLMCAFGVLINGVVMVTSYVVNSFTLISLFAAGVGLCIGMVFTIHSTILVDLFGISSFIRGQAILTCFLGFGALIGTPMAGLIFDMTQDYNLTFVVMGLLVIVGAMFVFLVYYLAYHQSPQSLSLPPPDTADDCTDELQPSDLIVEASLGEDEDRGRCEVTSHEDKLRDRRKMEMDDVDAVEDEKSEQDETQVMKTTDLT